MAHYVPENFAHLTRRARWARWVLFVLVLVSGVGIALTFVELNYIDRARTGSVTLAELETLDQRQRIVGWTELALFLVTAVLFLLWFHRAYRNLDSLGSERQHSTKWAVGYWFIPILQLFRPGQMAGELWRGSEPRLGAERAAGTGGLVLTWWLTWVIAVFLSRLAYFRARSATTLDGLTSADHMLLLAEGLSVVAAVLAMKVVTDITARQEKRARLVGTAAYRAALTT